MMVVLLLPERLPKVGIAGGRDCISAMTRGETPLAFNQSRSDVVNWNVLPVARI